MSQIDSTLRVKLTQHWESNWLNIESQIDSTLKVKFTEHWESMDSNILQLPTLPGRILFPPVTQLFRSKWLNFFSRCIVLAYTRFSWSIKFIILDCFFFNKLSATKGKFKHSCLPYESLIRNGYIYTVRIAFLPHVGITIFCIGYPTGNGQSSLIIIIIVLNHSIIP